MALDGESDSDCDPNVLEVLGVSDDDAVAVELLVAECESVSEKVLT